jgi:acyl-CoA reductase-like NAD-dependent aldehyde dehydrogenase
VLSKAQALASLADVVVGQLPSAANTLFSPVVLKARDVRATALHEVEVFGPLVTLFPVHSDAEAFELVALGGGTLVTTVYTDELSTSVNALEAIGPYTGRLLFGSGRIAEFSTGPGLVLPQMCHGGPGRAGGGLELGGVRGLGLYLQTVAVQAARPILEKLSG